jgi:hypothetical protein
MARYVLFVALFFLLIVSFIQTLSKEHPEVFDYLRQFLRFSGAQMLKEGNFFGLQVLREEISMVFTFWHGSRLYRAH